MKGNRLAIFAGALILVVILMVVLLNFSSSDNPSRTGTKKDVEISSNNWSKSFGWNNLHPNGLYLLEDLINASGNFTEVYKVKNHTLLDSLLKQDSVMFAFIGDNFYLTEVEREALLASIGRGNDFFYSCNTMDFNLHSDLLNYTNYKFIYRKSISVAGKGTKFKLYKVFEGDTVFGKWNVVDTAANVDFESLLTAKDHAFYTRRKYAMGQIYGHLNPEAFFNYQLKTPDGFKHFQATLGKLKARKIYFLDFANYDPNQELEGTDEEENDSLFAPLLRYKSFKWALFIFILGFIAFLVFRSKRERPIIRITQSKKLSALSYVDTIAGIYFDRKKPEDAHKMMKANFYLNVQKYFYLDLKNEGEKRASALSEKSNVPLAEVNHLLELVESRKEISFQSLEELDKELRKFYLKSEIWKEEEKAQIDATYYSLNRGLFGAGVLLLVGALCIATSFMLLTYSLGVGILLWPVGIAAFVLANQMFKRPLLKYNKEEIIIYPLFGKSQTVALDEVYEAQNTGVRLNLKVIDKEEHTIKLLNLDKSDINLLENLVFRINNKGNDRRK